MDQSELMKFVSYDPETGIFTWIKKTSNRCKDGAAGSKKTGRCGKSYIQLTVKGISTRAHRFAWLYVYGEWPKDEIDHINGDGTDNRIKNLRSVSKEENGRNLRLKSNNTSGFCGVTWSKAAGKWLAQIKFKRRNICLGFFEDKLMAAQAAIDAKNKYGFHKNHGQSRPL